MQERNTTLLQVFEDLMDESSASVPGRLLLLPSAKQTGDRTNEKGKLPFVFDVEIFLEGGLAGSDISQVCSPCTGLPAGCCVF
jgi:hypothetical protein